MSGQFRQLFLVPGDDQRAGLDQRQVEAVADRVVFAIAGLHAGDFQRARRRVEAGVQDGAVALAGAGEDVLAGFQQQRLQPGDGEAPEDGTSDPRRRR
jgi:hypothetical protein